MTAGWYHCSVKPVSRSAGRSAVAAAAYRLGDKLRDEALDQTYDYSRRLGVVTAFTIAPEGSPEWARDPERLWNAAEAAENRRNSQVAREFELALPSAVSAEEREGIARAFAEHLVDRYGVAVTAAIHEPSVRGDERNHHAHILATTRSMAPDGLAKKTRILDDRKTGPQEVLHLREYAADLINEALERAGVEERVDHRSFETRGIEREATTHLGPTATEMERDGRESERGELNREVVERNEQLDRLVGELAVVEAEIVAEEERRLDERFGPASAVEAGTEAEAGPGLWESFKRAARGLFGQAQPEPAQNSDLPLTDAEKRGARDAVAEADNTESVEPQNWEPGIGHPIPWWQRAAQSVKHYGEAVRDLARGAWQHYVQWRGGDFYPDSPNPADKDDGPDMTRR